MIAGLVTVAALVPTGCGTVRGGYESAPYRVVKANGKFELRHYPTLVVVQTSMDMEGTRSDASFSRLFRFITGNNQIKQKIPMTTPVFMSGADTNATMSFVMPAKMKASEVPKPSDASVVVHEMMEGRFAVLRYSGGRNAKNETESLERLRAWMKQEGLKELSTPIYGYFDPPWTPAFLRWNEVMLRTQTDLP